MRSYGRGDFNWLFTGFRMCQTRAHFYFGLLNSSHSGRTDIQIKFAVLHVLPCLRVSRPKAPITSRFLFWNIRNRLIWRSPWEADSSTDCHEITHTLWNTKVYYRVYKSQEPDSAFSDFAIGWWLHSLGLKCRNDEHVWGRPSRCGLFFSCDFISIILSSSGPGSAVGIATGYGLDGPGIESR